MQRLTFHQARMKKSAFLKAQSHFFPRWSYNEKALERNVVKWLLDSVLSSNCLSTCKWPWLPQTWKLVDSSMLKFSPTLFLCVFVIRLECYWFIRLDCIETAQKMAIKSAGNVFRSCGSLLLRLFALDSISAPNPLLFERKKARPYLILQNKHFQVI